VSWLKEFFTAIITLEKKLNSRQAFISLLLIIFIAGGYLFYKEYNNTKIILAQSAQSQPSSSSSNEKAVGVRHRAGVVLQKYDGIKDTKTRAGAPVKF